MVGRFGVDRKDRSVTVLYVCVNDLEERRSPFQTPLHAILLL